MHQHKSNLGRKLFSDKKYITLETKIAKKLNVFFTEISPSFPRQIPNPSITLWKFLDKSQHLFTWKMSYHNELENAFFSLKIN